MPDRYPVSAIGSWAHADATVEEVTRRPDFWDYADIPRLSLEALMAGGLDPAYALAAVVLPEGDTALADGCHRYAVARDLGIGCLPVEFGAFGDWFPEVPREVRKDEGP